jgi:hypothetical protein
LLALTLSAPIKPGAVHRLIVDEDFERRLYEAIEVMPLVDEAFRRAGLVAEGRLSSRELGLGNIIGKALRSAFDASGELPLVGLWAAGLVTAAIDGYAENANVRLPEGLKTIAMRLLYGSSQSDVEALVEALSDVGDSEVLQSVEAEGLTLSSISMRTQSLGELFEVIQRVDRGFMMNAKGIDQVIALSKLFSGARSPVAGVVKVYLRLAADLKGGGELDILARSSELDPTSLLKLDRTLSRERPTLNRLLGGVFLAAYVGASSRAATGS